MPSRSLASFPGLSHICTRHASEPKALSLPLRHEIKAPSLSVAKPVKTNGPPLSFSTVSRSVPNVIPAYRQRLCGPCTRTQLGFCFGSFTFQNIGILREQHGPFIVFALSSASLDLRCHNIFGTEAVHQIVFT